MRVLFPSFPLCCQESVSIQSEEAPSECPVDSTLPTNSLSGSGAIPGLSILNLWDRWFPIAVGVRNGDALQRKDGIDCSLRSAETVPKSSLTVLRPSLAVAQVLRRSGHALPASLAHRALASPRSRLMASKSERAAHARSRALQYDAFSYAKLAASDLRPADARARPFEAGRRCKTAGAFCGLSVGERRSGRARTARQQVGSQGVHAGLAIVGRLSGGCPAVVRRLFQRLQQEFAEIDFQPLGGGGNHGGRQPRGESAPEPTRP